jgi:signal transduction histidine kinase
MVTPERAILTDKLTVVLGFSELLMEDAYGRLDPRQRQVLAEVVQAARDVKDLVRQTDSSFTPD